MKIFIFLLFCILFFIKPAVPQNYLNLLNTGKQIASVGVNANPNLNINTDYWLNIENSPQWIEQWGLIAQANLPLFSQKGFDFDLRFGAGSLINIAGNFKTILGISWNFSRTVDINGRYFHSGFKIDIFPGYYSTKWLFAPHLSLNYQPWININHSEYVIKAFQDLYPNHDGQFRGPKDGWFYQNNITLQTGIGIAYFKPKWQVNLTAGFQYQPNKLGLIALPDLGIMPFYGSLNFGYSVSSE